MLQDSEADYIRCFLGITTLTGYKTIHRSKTSGKVSEEGPSCVLISESGCTSGAVSDAAPRLLHFRSACCSLFLFRSPVHHGPRQDQDGEEGRSGDHREVLHAAGQRLPHQQARVRGDRHHPQQEAAQQDRGVRHTPDEAHPERAGQGHLHQAAGGGARAQGQLRARGLGSGPGDHRGRHRHQGDAQASGFRQPVQSSGDSASRRHELQDPSRRLDICNISLNKIVGKNQH